MIDKIKKYSIVSLLIFLSIIGYQFAGMVRATTPSASEFTLSSSPGKPPESIPYNSLPNWARMVDIRKVNPKIQLDIRYATTNNFVKRKLYPVARCTLRLSVAQRLSRVQQNLEKIGLGLKVYDCYRPLSVTKQMWAAMPNSSFIANPAQGSRHNRGAAVDLTLVNRQGKELEMPTPFDSFTEKSHRNYQGGSSQARKNSQLLERMMKEAGFIPLSTEWWHFDAVDWQKFSLLDMSLTSIP